MIEIIVLAAFFGLLVIGSIVANALGRLPNAEQLEAEDRARMTREERAFE